ncbi:formylglycine-generating enzyme family protein [Luteolibacter luteus]|uniref:SUMF1/EgtB/PvdO family nonheme iron enzyme n=1 Tax=Luteolibacter luteus TaxID=2728835 RepID=A0A858RPK6_9BACT|nr:SUMF1/EgtB/PvdO family nonheme iron enzyme [Luteolibacter luteus]QJE98279.1 SUMF1/EgtB/PvdO family nonheme iron enzyme [Luteolibacter luteus]
MKGILGAFALCFFAHASRAAEPTLELDLGQGTKLDLVLIQSGSFTQGSPASESGRGADEAQREVILTKDYYIGRSTVTFGQWERFVAETGYRSEAETGTSGGYGWNGSALEQRKNFTWRTPGFAQAADSPVCLLTFPDAQKFCEWLEKKTGRKITLPTEAQWEYACRAGTTTPWHHPEGAGSAWHKDNAGNGTRTVGSKPANPWGLFIGGNVSEWCLDWYGPYPAGEATDPRQDNSNLSDKPRRVLRGGSWNRGPSNTRSAARYRADPRSRNADTGFRIVCSVEAPAPVIAPPSQDLPPVESGTPSASDEATSPMQPGPETPHDPIDAEQGPSRPSSPIRGLLCLLIPAFIVFKIFRAVSRRNNAMSGSTMLNRPAPRPDPRPIPQAVPPVLKTDDGFWIRGDWPEGTALQVRYMVAGAVMMQEILYRPGEKGQFIYTGNKPDSVSVLAGADPENTVENGIFSSSSSSTFRDRDRDRDDDRDRRPPPQRPSAY